MVQNQKKHRKRTRVEGTVGKTMIVCFLVLFLFNLLVPDKEMSEEENRMLEGKPKLTWNGLTSGSFMSKTEDYLSDQFAGRNLWRSLKVKLNRLGGSREENGVLIGKEGYLMEKIVSSDQEVLKENLETIEKFAGRNKDVEMYMMLVPDAANIKSDLLPTFATVADQNRMFAQVKRELGDSLVWLDAAQVLKDHKEEEIYYKTDHHWTSLGAFYTFGAVAEQMNIKTEVASSYASYPVSTSFNGTLAAKSGCGLHEKERIDIYVPTEMDTEVVVNYVDEQKKTTSLYDSSKLKTRDQYAVFMGGNTSLVDIKTVSESKRRLLVIKDSFANCFVPFLTPYFREIILVDPRYYSGRIDEVMETYRISDTLFLYSGNTFFHDNNISGVLGREQDESEE